jgi:hypothetical protein
MKEIQAVAGVARFVTFSRLTNHFDISNRLRGAFLRL